MSDHGRVAIYHGSDQGSVVAMPRTAATIPSEGDLKTMLTLGETFIKSGLMPAAIKTAAAAVVIIQKGRELNIPPMQAINGINVIQGKPTCSSDLMTALIYRDHGDNALRWLEASNDSVTLAYKRRSWAEPSTFTWTKEDSNRAGLKGGNHDKYPGAMMRARAISAVARMAFNDSIGGMYLPEEIEEGVELVAAPTPSAVASGPSVVVEADFSDGDRKRANDALHAAADKLGMSHEDIKQFVSEETGKPVGSMTTWDIKQLVWARGLVERKGQQWVYEQGGEDVIDAETGEFVPADTERFPVAPASLLPSEDPQPTNRRDWTN